MHSENAPDSSIPYTSPNITHLPVHPSGGDLWQDKLVVLKHYPEYFGEILRAMNEADFVHIRCPANISLLAIIILTFLRKPRFRWVKYAGNWKPKGGEPFSYRLQRYWLQMGLHRGVVSINGRWTKQPHYVYSFLNPCIEVKDANSLSSTFSKDLGVPINILFVGAIRKTKGIEEVLKISLVLSQKDISYVLHLVGDGEDRSSYEAWVEENEIKHNVNFHGWLSRQALNKFYKRAHCLLFPSYTEGFPKVLSEGMAFGVVPIASDVSSIPQVLSDTGAGLSFPVNDTEAYVDAICDFVEKPDYWRRFSQAGRRSAHLFTYSAYIKAVQEMAFNAWGIHLTYNKSHHYD